MAIKSILVDLDGVIRHWPNINFDIEVKYFLPKNSLKKAAFSEQLLNPAIRGQYTDSEWRQAIVDTLAKAHPESDVENAVYEWSKSIGSIDVEVLSLLASYHNHDLALVTNATTRLNSDLAAHQIIQTFDYIFNTSDIGYAKPEILLFTHVLDCMNIVASDALFIDDSAENVEAAKQMGINAHIYAGLDPLKVFLSSHISQ